MPKESRRTRSIRRAIRRTKLDRKICPYCGAEVHRWDRRNFACCISCHQHFLWKSVPEVPTTKPPSKPTLRYSGHGSPAMSTIEERSESGDRGSSPSSRDNSMDDDEHTPDHDSLGRSADDNSNIAAAFASLTSDHKDDIVVGEAFVDPVLTRNTGSIPPEDWRWPLSTWEIVNKKNINPLPHITAVPVVGLDEQNQTAVLQATDVPQLIPNASHPISQHPLSLRTTSPRPITRRKRCKFGERFRRKRAEPIEPSPSLEDIIRIPEAVPRQRAAELLNTLILARYTHSRGISTEPTTASPMIVPQEPDGILQQHATDLHNALERLEALESAHEREEESLSSGGKSFWSQFSCFR